MKVRAGLIRREISGREHFRSVNVEPLVEASTWIDEQQSFWEVASRGSSRFSGKKPARVTHVRVSARRTPTGRWSRANRDTMVQTSYNIGGMISIARAVTRKSPNAIRPL